MMVMVVKGFQRVVVVFQLGRMSSQSEGVVRGVRIGTRVQSGHHVEAENDCGVSHESDLIKRKGLVVLADNYSMRCLDFRTLVTRRCRQ